MFTDELRNKVWDDVRQRDIRAFGRSLSHDVFVEAAAEAGVKLGKSALSLTNLVWLGISCAIHTSKNFCGVLEVALKILEDAGSWQPAVPKESSQQKNGEKKSGGQKGQEKSKYNPYGKSPTSVTEEAFSLARKAMPQSFWIALILILGKHFEQQHGRLTRWKQYRLLALDGTTISLSAWQKLRAYFGAARNGKSKPRTQARMLMLQLPLVRMPWRYVLGSIDQGERTLAAELLQFLYKDDLVLLDRGFWSYGLFHQIQNRNAFFAIRLSNQIKLHRVKRLGNEDWLVRWKMPTGPRWRDSDLDKEISLRLVKYKIPGFRPSGIVTNVLSPQKISREDWIRLACDTEPGDERLGVGLYHRRWEIETTFRELKVTQGMEGKLRGRTPETIHYEIAGHVLLYLLVRWLIVEAAVEHGIEDPLRLSFKEALEELKDMRQSLLTATPKRVAEVLLPRLLERIAKHLVPLRPGRSYPRPKDSYARYRKRKNPKHQKKLRKTAKTAAQKA
jgi:hypothetical protein